MSVIGDDGDGEIVGSCGACNARFPALLFPYPRVRYRGSRYFRRADVRDVRGWNITAVPVMGRRDRSDRTAQVLIAVEFA